MKSVARRCDLNRGGFSLIELVVVIAMLGAIFTLVGTTCHLLMRSEKTVTQSFVTERTISRLAALFRDDVHQSATGVIRVGAANSNVELVLGDSNGTHVRYAMTADALARLNFEKDTIVARDDFRLPECLVRFTAGDEADPLLRTLVIERPAATLARKSQALKPLRALEIQAYLHRARSPIRDAGSANSDSEIEGNRDKRED